MTPRNALRAIASLWDHLPLDWSSLQALSIANAGLAEREKMSDAEDAARWRWLREQEAYMRPCMIQRNGYRSTASNAPWETWDEQDGWIVSTDPIDTEAMSMDQAIDRVRAKS